MRALPRPRARPRPRSSSLMVDALMGHRGGDGMAGGDDESGRRLKTEILKQMDGIEAAAADAARSAPPPPLLARPRPKSAPAAVPYAVPSVIVMAAVSWALDEAFAGARAHLHPAADIDRAPKSQQEPRGREA